MADDDETGEVGASVDPIEPGPRRTTYTPPPASEGGVHDDDALADALAAEFARIASGPIPIVPQPSAAETPAEFDDEDAVINGPPAHEPPAYDPPVVPEYPASAPIEREDAATEPPAPEPPMPEPEPWQPTQWEPPVTEGPAWEAPAGEPAWEAPAAGEPAWEAPAPEQPEPTEWAEPALETPASSAQPAWMNLPAPDPAQAVDLPEGPPQRPVRRSLPDDQLVGWVDEAAKEPGGTLNVIEGLESQLRLREEEAREFQAWEQTMRAVGTPDAISEVEEARPEFTGVLPDLGGAVLGGAAAAIEPEPEVAFEPPVEPEPQVPDPEPEPEVFEPAPSFEPEATVAPVPPAYDSSSEDLYRPPTGWFIPAPMDEPIPLGDEPVAGDSVVSDPAADDVPLGPVTGAFVLPEEPLAAWPAPQWDDAEALPAPVDDASAVVEPMTEEPSALDEPDDLATGDLPVDAVPVWNLDDEPDAEPTPAVAYEPEPESRTEPAPETGLAPPEQEGFFLPEPEYEPLHPTHPIETIARGERVEPGLADDVSAAVVPAAVVEPVASPFAPPPLVEPAPLYPSAEVEPVATTFDDLLAGAPEEGEPVGIDPEPEPPLNVETLFIEPLPASAHEPPVTTGSVTIIDQAYQEEIDDDVDETDRVVQAFGPVSVDTAGIAIVAPPVSPPSGPISTVRIREDEAVLAAAPPKQPVFSLEASGVEPTPIEFRIGRAARLFWLWFASNASILSLGLGAAVYGLGLSLSQSVIAIIIGVALSFIPLGLSTLAGKRSGQPTMVVSRATFGLLGNVVPAVIALVSRLFWGAVLLWFLATSLAVVLVGSELNGSLSERQLLLIGLAGGLAIAALIAFFGYALLARIQLVLTIISAVLVIGLIGFTWQYVDVQQALTTPYGPWELVVTGAVLVFSFVGLVWANSAGDLARYQRPDSSGPATLLLGPFGVTVPAFVLIAYGALLAASNEGIASGFMLSPLDTLALMLPSWYPIPLLAATVLSLLSGVAVSLYSGGFALQAIGVRVPRPYSVPIVAVLLAGVTLLITFAVPGGNLELFRDVATTLAVPIAAWAGIFAAEMMIRSRRFESQSLLQRGGVYPDVRWLNLIGFIVISVIGFGLTTASVTWLSWQGYGFGLLAVPLDSDLAGTDLGVFVALVLGLLVPIVAGIPGIRRQEATEV